MKTYFCFDITIDGTPVNAVTETTKRGIERRLKDNPRGFYREMKPSNLHPDWQDHSVYVWSEYDEDVM